MRLNQLLLELHSMEIYPPEPWDEYIGYFLESDQIRAYIREHQKAYQPSKDPAYSLTARIKSGKGVNQTEVDYSISPKIVTVGFLSDPELRGKMTLGIVSGAFDLLHLGHARYMHEAKGYFSERPNPKLCALTLSDKNITEKKGERTPIMNINERLEMIAGMAAVDYVIPLVEPDCLAALGRIKPDYFLKAGRDSSQGIVKREVDLVASYGGAVIILVPGSPCGGTTGKIIDKVLRGG